ncbi:MAG: MORN repeat variant [Lentisphaerae bacterium ADurb.BinA184]|nr:MAG: MORN repeat variant [Lentisphaerae bacterium ADurb.BinA184]
MHSPFPLAIAARPHLLAILGLMPWLALTAAAEPPEDGGNSDVCVVDKATALPNAMVKENDVRRVGPFVKALPDGYTARIEFATFGAGGDNRTIRYVCQMTPLDPDGRIDGTETAFADWYRKPSRLSPFKQDVRHGVERLFQNGGEVLQAEVPWEDGKIHGVKKTYHPSGALASETTYVQGSPTGLSRSFAPDGQLLRALPFKDGRRNGPMTDYWPGRGETVQRVIEYRDGEVDGMSREYYADGKVKWEKPFRRNTLHGIERHFAPDGTVERTRFWLDGKEVGEAAFKDAAP